ncbi:hypothetical protein EIN_253230 [Entamoeba invadens IP1]|uniref:Uncharacterized protein n=1 Tax=Entamoeba invadens IP1 TaxID=370355 RepID=A0A0A1UGQ7_ENTIV|nr:hypothetical protein EIN_253230 [Entamoeba invadens IP1]ELP95059.1 hypothetical protein EIN_253230 [Entamoeba invadens IP1]|eukprot:XP_004261830.1 hypothetical protein EIN_253230 [Entamoeba invadens IP1]
MSVQFTEQQLNPCRPVPFVLQNCLPTNNSYGWSPTTAYSLPQPKNVYSPLLVVTPMDTPMVEDDSEELKYNPPYLEQDVFAFDEQMDGTKSNLPSKKCQGYTGNIGITTCRHTTQKNGSGPIYLHTVQSSKLNNDKITVQDFGAQEDFVDDEDSQGFEEDQDDMEDSDDQNENIQEVIDKLEELKKMGDERNRLLKHMIQGQQ